ncbi:hypothetical protein Syun_029322 [Stephania yunnanensis]|uniref:Uncharacterized protein n=1 Tax=Stephania yunnanensis TaxID=152371 RepID=A0AAP0E8E3_9MAGN
MNRFTAFTSPILLPCQASLLLQSLFTVLFDNSRSSSSSSSSSPSGSSRLQDLLRPLPLHRHQLLHSSNTPLRSFCQFVFIFVFFTNPQPLPRSLLYALLISQEEPKSSAFASLATPQSSQTQARSVGGVEELVTMKTKRKGRRRSFSLLEPGGEDDKDEDLELSKRRVNSDWRSKLA